MDRDQARDLKAKYNGQTKGTARRALCIWDFMTEDEIAEDVSGFVDELLPSLFIEKVISTQGYNTP